VTFPHYVVPRIAARLVVDAHGCWVWQGARTSNGYGQTERRRRMMRVHRWVYAMSGRTIPDGYDLDHDCRQRLCANPDHLTPRPHDEHGRLSRALRGGYDVDGVCANGHDVTAEGALYVRPDGRRECRECRAEARRNLAAWEAGA
jgi:hypothetical protein